MRLTIEREARLIRTAQLSVQRFTNFEIAEKLTFEGFKDVTESDVESDVTTLINRWKRTQRTTTEEMMAAHQMFLDILQQQIWSFVLAGDIRAAKLALEIEVRRAKLNGLEVQKEPEKQIINLIWEGGSSKQLEAGDGSTTEITQTTENDS